MAIGAVWAVAVLLLAPLCAGEIRVSKIRLDSSRIIMLDNFVFTQRGHLEITVRDASYEGPKKLDPSHMGFFLSTQEAWPNVLDGIICAFDTTLVKPIFTFNNLQNKAAFNISYQDFDAKQYTLAFANCNLETFVSMDVTTVVYNLEGGGNDYLSVGETELPWVYFCMSLIYLVLSVIWIYVVVKRRAMACRIHVLMIALVCLKALNLICEAEDKSYINRTGTAHGWNVLFYILSFFEGIMFFTVILLIYKGCSFLKPYLQGKDKEFLMGLISLQVIVNIINILIDETLPCSEDWGLWKLLFWCVDVVCCGVVLFPIAASSLNLDEASDLNLDEAAHTNDDAARTADETALTDDEANLNLMLFGKYFIGLFCYVFLTRAVVYPLAIFIAYQYAWIIILIGELVTLWFYVFTGYMFQPVEHSPCSEDEEGAVKMDEDFEL